MIAPDWTDNITVMQARGGKRLAKMHNTDGTTADYDDAWLYDAQVVPVSGLLDVCHLLQWLLPRQDRCIVRGEPIGELNRIRRLVHHDQKTDTAPTLRDVPRRWLAVDWDGIDRPADVPASDLEACGDIALETMPEVFRQAGCIVQASAGHGIKPGVRLRGWFWCDRPMTGRELKRWLGHISGVDRSVFNPAQPIYSASPVFGPGRTEHLRERVCLLPGSDQEPWLVCPSPEALADSPRPIPEAVKPLCVSGSARAHLYVEAARMKAHTRITTAVQRHPAILSEACGLARFVQAGLMSESDLHNTLWDAAKQAGKDDETEIERMVAFGLEHPDSTPIPVEMRHG